MSGLIRPGWSLSCYLQGWTQRKRSRAYLHPVSNEKGIGMTWGKGIDPSLQMNPLVASQTSLMWRCCWNHLQQHKNSTTCCYMMPSGQWCWRMEPRKPDLINAYQCHLQNGSCFVCWHAFAHTQTEGNATFCLMANATCVDVEWWWNGAAKSVSNATAGMRSKLLFWNTKKLIPSDCL